MLYTPMRYFPIILSGFLLSMLALPIFLALACVVLVVFGAYRVLQYLFPQRFANTQTTRVFKAFTLYKTRAENPEPSHTPASIVLPKDAVRVKSKE